MATKKKVEVKRASLKKLLKFANEIREAGGGNPIDALIPAVPVNAEECLIARNLNFNCTVNGAPDPGSEEPWEAGDWAMYTNRKVRDAIAEKLGLHKIEYKTEAKKKDGDYILTKNGDYRKKTVYGVVLPRDIGLVARDFDEVVKILNKGRKPGSQKQKDLLKEMWPYIETSVKEAYKNATYINENGELVL